ncbi:helix-turn-helix domain-containing protein [Aerococcus urinae]|uniref:helix-turn-helix domain-containing protein n=1 Tax=Aerococcus urinae TaxID=1376 RepID=UPI00227C77C2|nr:helix-turn-helix transcriptional regulator [Aerococcus urinae]MCY3050966.1 helix-turn-helix domain-containing protein [Aerococcus urinae]
MTLADKILDLCKKRGWSQEKLAEKIQVSRQSVSKWESSQSIPDMKRVAELSQIFGVSIDYLIKDDIEESEGGRVEDKESDAHFVSMEEANDYLKFKEKNQSGMANAISLFILSPIILIILLGLTKAGYLSLTEGAAISLGVIGLLITVAYGIYRLILSIQKEEAFEYLEKEAIETEYGVTSMVEKRVDEFRPNYYRGLGLDVGLIIMGGIPLVSSVLIQEPYEAVTSLTPILTLVFLAWGINLLIRVGIPWEVYKVLLSEGDYSLFRKYYRQKMGPITSIYWPFGSFDLYRYWSDLGCLAHQLYYLATGSPNLFHSSFSDGDYI